MKLEALEAFCEVVRLKSFSRGAASVGISQSAASQLVAGLEEQLGFRLIDRKRRPLVPTIEGELYYEGCRDMLQLHRRVLDEISRQRHGLASTVRVAAIYSAGLHTLSRYIPEFMARNSSASVRLEYFHPKRVYDLVLDGEADIGVISYPRSHRDLRVIP